MPTYDYICDACDHKFEEFQSITAAALTTCPKCRKRKLRRLIGPGAAIVFKGSGFYTTDYRSAAYTKAAAADKNGGSSSSDGKTDAKAGGKETAKKDASREKSAK